MERRALNTRVVRANQGPLNVKQSHGHPAIKKPAAAPAKRLAENRSPEQKAFKRNRTAFGDITNKEDKKDEQKKPQKKSLKGKKKKTVVLVPRDSAISENRSSQPTKTTNVSYDLIELSQGSQSSQELQSSQSSSCSSEESIDVDSLILNSPASQNEQQTEEPTWEDIDKEHLNDPTHVGLYAYEIFQYYKEREVKFQLPDFLAGQKDLTSHMRAILVDWLVEVQENFELNHETLYLAIKVVDHYLAKVPVHRERLQLVGATSLFIACKFDERCPPVLDDFLYICDDAYLRKELIQMEQTVLRAIDFDLGIPLSYRFLRRFAKCARAPMDTLTLARYILETAQMDYKFALHKDSQLGAACLRLALLMKKDPAWTPTLVHFTGYTDADLLPLVEQLNAMIAAPPNRQLNTIRNKYSHRVFHEVATVPALDTLALDSVRNSGSPS